MDIARLRDELIKDEGLRLKPYKCTGGKTTIGVGRNIQDRGITESEAHHLLDNDIALSKAELAKQFIWFEHLSDARQRAMINLHFNLGLPTLKKFKKFLAAMKIADYPEAAKELLDSRWARQVKSRATRIQHLILNG